MRPRKQYPSDVIREQFERVRSLFEGVRKRTKLRTVDLYEVFNAVLYLLKSGCQWRMLPDGFPKWRTVHSYFAKWSEPGPDGISVLERVESLLVDGGYTGQPFADGRKERLEALRMAGKVPKALEELRTETQYKLAVRSPRLPRPPTQKIVNRS
jgi:hypothetical protein